MLYRPDLLFHQQYPTWYGSKVTRCQMPTDTVPTVTRLAPEPRGDGVSASIRRRGGWMDGRVNRRELSIHVVKRNKPKMLMGLSQNGTGAGTGAHPSPVMDTERYRQKESTSPMLVNLVERGKPVSLLSQEREESRKADQRRCGYGGGKKRRPSCNETDTG
jgi:hypothetical protein